MTFHANFRIKDCSDSNSRFYRNKTGVAQNKDDIDHLKKVCKELEEKSLYIDENLSDLKANMETTNINMTLNHKSVTYNHNYSKFHPSSKLCYRRR